MHIFYCKLFPLIHPGKILIRSAILVVYLFPICCVVLNPLHDMLRIIVSTTRPVDIQTDTARPILMIPHTRFLVLIIHFVVWSRVIFYKTFQFL